MKEQEEVEDIWQKWKKWGQVGEKGTEGLKQVSIKGHGASKKKKGHGVNRVFPKVFSSHGSQQCDLWAFLPTPWLYESLFGHLENRYSE